MHLVWWPGMMCGESMVSYTSLVLYACPPPLLLLKVAPSILGAAVCEAVAFLVGALTDIPALRQFCLVAATSVVVGFVLQVTFFFVSCDKDQPFHFNHFIFSLWFGFNHFISSLCLGLTILFLPYVSVSTVQFLPCVLVFTLLRGERLAWNRFVFVFLIFLFFLNPVLGCSSSIRPPTSDSD